MGSSADFRTFRPELGEFQENKRPEQHHGIPDVAFGLILLPKFQYSHFSPPRVELVHPSHLSSLCPTLLHSHPTFPTEPESPGKMGRAPKGSPRDSQGIPRESLLQSFPGSLGERGKKIPPNEKLTSYSHHLFLFFFFFFP